MKRSREMEQHIARLKTEQPIIPLDCQFPRPIWTIGFVLTLFWTLALLISALMLLHDWLF